MVGILLQNFLLTNVLTAFRVVWKFPTTQVGLTVVFVLVVTVISIISPLKRLKQKGISEVIGAL